MKNSIRKRNREALNAEKKLRQALISSTLSITMCMGCIAGSAWSLFSVDLNSTSTLAMMQFQPEFLNKTAPGELPSYSDGAYLLQAGNQYSLKLQYDKAVDDLNQEWYVDALLSFHPIDTPTMLENYNLYYHAPDSVEEEEEEEEETTQSPDSQMPDDSSTEEADNSSNPEEESTNLSSDSKEAENDISGDTGDEESGTPGNSEEASSIPDSSEETDGTTDSSEEVTDATSDDLAEAGEAPGDSHEEADVTSDAPNKEVDDTSDDANTDANPENSQAPLQDLPAVQSETDNSEDPEKILREQKIQELLEKLDSTDSGASFDYRVSLELKDSETGHYELTIENLKVRANTLLRIRAAIPFEAEDQGQSDLVSSLSLDGDGAMPYYYQGDYPDTMYGKGTVATSGCSVTSLAMIASYMTGHPYYPDEIARYFGGLADSDLARLEIGLQKMQIPYEKPENIDFTYQELQKGKVAIVLMGHTSAFTDSQHFIVLSGLTEDGKIIVHDPNRTNESRWELADGFQNGFSKSQLTTGYGGAWVFDKSQMPEVPFLYHMEELMHTVPRYPDIHLTAFQKQILAKLIWLEAQGESAEGQQAIAEVVLNRLSSNHFGANLQEVLMAEGQFQTAKLLDIADPYQAQYEAIERAIWGPYVLPTNVYYYATSAVNENIWGSIGGHVFCGVPLG